MKTQAEWELLVRSNTGRLTNEQVTAPPLMRCRKKLQAGPPPCGIRPRSC